MNFRVEMHITIGPGMYNIFYRIMRFNYLPVAGMLINFNSGWAYRIEKVYLPEDPKEYILLVLKGQHKNPKELGFQEEFTSE